MTLPIARFIVVGIAGAVLAGNSFVPGNCHICSSNLRFHDGFVIGCPTTALVEDQDDEEHMEESDGLWSGAQGTGG